MFEMIGDSLCTCTFTPLTRLYHSVYAVIIWECNIPMKMEENTVTNLAIWALGACVPWKLACLSLRPCMSVSYTLNSFLLLSPAILNEMGLSCVSMHSSTISLDWYSSQTETITGDYTGELVAFTDAGQAPGRNVIFKLDDVYMQFNRATGMNSGTREKVNEVVLVQGTQASRQSEVLAGLGSGESYSTGGFTIEVCSINYGSVDYAYVSIFANGGRLWMLQREVWAAAQHAKTTFLRISSFMDSFETVNGLQRMGLGTFAMKVPNIGARALAGRVHNIGMQYHKFIELFLVVVSVAYLCLYEMAGGLEC